MFWVILFYILGLVKAQDTVFDTSIDYFNASKVTLEPNVGFSIEYHNWYKIVTNHLNNETYALVCCNQTLNATGYHAVINIPLQHVAVDSVHSILSYIELLGLTGSVASIAAFQNVTSPCYSNITDRPATNVDAVFSQRTNTDSGMATIGFPVDQDTLNPIQKAAWLMYVGAFFDKEGVGSIVFQNIRSSYVCHQANLANVSNKKSMAWTTHDLATSLWTLDVAPYYSQLTIDAGMTLVRANASTQLPLIAADMVLDRTPGVATYNAWLALAGINSTDEQFIIDRNVFRTDGLVNVDGYSDWPQRSPARPDLALTDLIHIAYPTYDPTYSFVWMRNFAKLDSTRTYSNCSQELTMPVCNSREFRNDNSTRTISQPSDGQQTLSTGGKVGIALGVMVGVLGAAMAGWLAHRRGWIKPEHTFYKMKDLP